MLADFVRSKGSLRRRLAYTVRMPTRRQRLIDQAVVRALVALGWH